MNRRQAILAAIASCVVGGAWGQSYPTRSIKLIVPFAAGGSTDIIARMVAEPMRKELGQVVVVENIGGAAGALGTMQVAQGPADGDTLAVATVSTMIVYSATRANPLAALKGTPRTGTPVWSPTMDSP